MGPKSAGAYVVAGDHILAKLFEDELTLVNLDSGEYFAAGGIAVDLWSELATPRNSAELAQAIIARYAATPDIVVAEVRKLLGDLSANGLVRQTEDVSGVPAVPAVVERKPWPGSWLEVYGDMKDLLLLDPVHDVGEAGWPPFPPVKLD